MNLSGKGYVKINENKSLEHKNYMKITRNQALSNSAKLLANKSRLIVKNIMSLKTKIKNLEVLSKSKSGNLQKMLLEIYNLLHARLGDFNFVKIIDDVADIVNGYGIDFVRLLGDGRLIENDVDITYENKKAAALLKDILIILSELSGISKKNFLTGIFILKTLDPKLKTGRNLINIKKDDYRVLDEEIYSNGRNKLKNNLEILIKMSSDANDLLKNSKEFKTSGDGLEKICNEIFINYGKIRAKSKLLPKQCNTIRKNIENLPNMAQSMGITESLPDMKNFLEVASGWLPSSFPKDVKLIKNLTVKTMKNLQTHSSALYIRIMDNQSKIYRKIVSKILDYLKSIFILKENKKSVEFFNLKKEIKKMEDKMKEVNDYLNSQSKNSVETLNWENILEDVKKNICKTNCPEIKINFKNFVGSGLTPEEQKEKILKEMGISNEVYNVQKTLEKFESNYSNNQTQLIAAIYIFTQDLAKMIGSLSSYVAEVAAYVARLSRDIKRATPEKFISKISSVTSAIGTIGCFAGFAMTSICPIVGWAIFAVCSVAFIFNFTNALYKMRAN